MSNNIYESPSSDVSNQSDEVVKLTIMEILFSFSGRVPRSIYWLLILGMFVFLFVWVGVVGIIAGDGSPFMAVFGLLYIPIIWISLAIQVKRWHDRDKSGWWVFIALVPIIGGIWAFVENGCLSGTDGVNRFGPPSA